MANDTVGDAGSAQRGPAPAAVRLEIASGHPSAEEVAAVTIALMAKLAASAQPAPPPTRRGNWADLSRMLRLPVSPGPDAWRRSAGPS